MRKKLLILLALLFAVAMYLDRLHPVIAYQKLEAITHIEVEKQKRQMSVYSDGKPLKTYAKNIINHIRNSFYLCNLY